MKANPIRLLFLTNEAGEEEGLNDAGIETFKDTPYASVARECGQNSMDAGQTNPVIVSFDRFSIPLSEMPSLDEYKTAIAACLAKAKSKGNEKEVDFFVRAHDILNGQEINVLKISDFNTKGLEGPSKPGTPFHSLIKAMGVSKKDSDTSAGSFGIGKNAAFAMSELQTVLYSTVYHSKETGQDQFLAQGKSILISHLDASGTERRARGYWGRKGFDPVTEANAVPAWLRRKDIGTSVYIVGFRETDHWQFKIAASVLRNFFCAIQRGTMEFLIDGRNLKIDRSTIKQLFQDPRITKAADDDNQKDDFEFSQDLFECLNSHEAVQKEFRIAGLGKVVMRILVREGLPKRLYIIRNGMAISDNLTHFGHKFTSFPMYKDFVALIEPVDDEGSKLIKQLENPRHDGLSAERIPDASKRTAATKTMKELGRMVRDMIRAATVTRPADETPIDELSEFFSDPQDQETMHDPGAEDNPESSTYTRGKKAPPQTSSGLSSTKGGDQGGAGGTSGESGGAGGGTGPGTGRGTGGSGSLQQATEVQLSEIRNVLTGDGSGERRVFFTPDRTCNAVIAVQAAGLQNPELLTVTKSDIGIVADGQLTVDLVAAKRMVVQMAFQENYRGPIELAVISTGV